MTTADTGIDPALFGVHPRRRHARSRRAPDPRVPAAARARESGDLRDTDGGGGNRRRRGACRISRVYVDHWHEAASGDASDAAAVRARGRPRGGGQVPRSCGDVLEATARRRLRGDPTPGTRPGQRPYLWRTPGTASSSPATRSILRDGEWTPRCWTRAIASGTSRASSSFANWLRCAGSVDRDPPTGRTSRSPTAGYTGPCRRNPAARPGGAEITDGRLQRSRPRVAARWPPSGGANVHGGPDGRRQPAAC